MRTLWMVSGSIATAVGVMLLLQALALCIVTNKVDTLSNGWISGCLVLMTGIFWLVLSVTSKDD